MEDNFELELWNTQVEMIVLGSLFARPEEVGFSYIDVVKNSDFHPASQKPYLSKWFWERA